MDFNDRLVWFIIGCVLGYVVRSLKEIKDDLDKMNKNSMYARNEHGLVRHPILLDICLFFVVSLTLFAAFQSQVASNNSNDAVDKISSTQAAIVGLQLDTKKNLDCTTQIAFDTIRALNERTTFTGQQAEANIALVQGQLNFLTAILDPNITDAQGKALFEVYINKVENFIELANKTTNQQIINPYPTVEDLSECLVQQSNQTDKLSGVK